MEEIRKNEGSAKSLKYTQPKLVALDDNKGVEGSFCNSGSAAGGGGCAVGTAGGPV